MIVPPSRANPAMRDPFADEELPTRKRRSDYIEMTGNIYGRLTVMENAGSSQWWCDCECGQRKLVSGSALRGGRTLSCGCLQDENRRGDKARDISGETYGRLTVIRREGTADSEHPLWLCECECGNTCLIKGGKIGKEVNSCGCLRAPVRASSDGLGYGHPLFQCWSGAKSRCLDVHDPKYHRYGGRGITMCDRWLNSFRYFVEDMGDRPAGASLDRVDNDGNYEPGNCRWATPLEQNQNRSNSRKNKKWASAPLVEDKNAQCDYFNSIRTHLMSSPRGLQISIGPSEFSPCDRQIAGKLFGLPKTPQAAWRPATGTAIHSFLEDLFSSAEVLPDGGPRWLTERRVKVGLLDGKPLTGSCDLYDRLTHTTVDHKYVGITTLKSVRAGKISQRYKTQQQLYAHGLVAAGFPVKDVAICYLPASGELEDAVWWAEPYDPAIAEEALLRVNEINNRVKQGEPLDAFKTSEDWCSSCPVLLARMCPGETKSRSAWRPRTTPAKGGDPFA